MTKILGPIFSWHGSNLYFTDDNGYYDSDYNDGDAGKDYYGNEISDEHWQQHKGEFTGFYYTLKSPSWIMWVCLHKSSALRLATWVVYYQWIFWFVNEY